MDLNTNNPVIQLCIQGTQAEFRGELALAAALYQQAWALASNDYEACIAAHYVARHQTDLGEKLRWNEISLQKADACGDERVRDFYPSLLLNMGQSHELLGNLGLAQQYYDQAAVLGVIHQS